MPIVRNSVNDYYKVDFSIVMERQAEDFDLAWGDHRVYIIDSHESFEHRLDGVIQEPMRGPAMIVVNNVLGYFDGDLLASKHHVNDPFMWAWIRRAIAEGFLASDSLDKSVACDETEITIPLR